MQGKKKRDAADAETKRLKEKAEQQDTDGGDVQQVTDEAEASVDLLSSKDEDVIF